MNNTSLRTLALTGIIGSLLAVTACSSPAPAPAQTSSPVASASPSATADASATPSPVASTVDKPATANGVPLTGTHGLKVKGPASNDKGSYLQITARDSDPFMKYDPQVVMPEISSKYTAEEIASAQKFAMTFVVEEGFDSTINDGNNVTEWLSRNIGNFDPRVQDQVVAAAKGGSDFVNLRGWGKDQQYTYFYDKDSTRIVSYEIPKLGVKMSANPANADSILFEYPYQIVAAEKNLKGNVYAGLIKGEGKIGVRKDPSNPGKWLITEMFTKYEGSADKSNMNP